MAIRLEIYKKGQGTPIRVFALIVFALLAYSGCHWVYGLPEYDPLDLGWYGQARLTGGALLAFAVVAAAGTALFRLAVRGRSDREYLRWAGFAGGLVLAGFLAKWLAVDLLGAKTAALQRTLIPLPSGVTWGRLLCYGIGLPFLVWVSACLVVNHPRRADFLIETETELRKVAWPARREYVGASLVVILMVFIVAMYLWGVDVILSWILMKMHIGI